MSPSNAQYSHSILDQKIAERLAATAHHIDCDGYRLAHRVNEIRDGSMRRYECEECGPLHTGSYGKDCTTNHMSHTHHVACDGRCQAWA